MTIYKRIGDYIREVNVRNRELKVTQSGGQASGLTPQNAGPP